MNINTTIEPETTAVPTPAAALSGSVPRGIESWLRAHVNVIAVAITAAGFIARLVAANATYFNPDESLHYLLINEPSLWLAYKASLTNAHPPLIYVLVYFWRLLGRSEVMLRFPLVLAGTGFCWFFFKWVQRLFGNAAGLLALVLAAFSPTLVTLSAELREYALLLCGMCAALYFLEKAFDENSPRKMWLFSLSLYFAILSHYSAAFFALTVGLYVLARLVESHFPRKLTLAWTAGQAGALLIYLALYLTHLANIRKSLAVWATSFGETLYHFDQDSIFQFTRQNTWNIFFYLFPHQYAAAAMLVCFIAGIGFLITLKLSPARPAAGSPHLALLLLVPFLAVWAAAVAGIYPYIGSRHTVFLAPFAIAAASFLLAKLSRQKLWPAALFASALMILPIAYGRRPEPGLASQSRPLMKNAIDYLHQSAGPHDLILADMQSSISLAYYYCGSKQPLFMAWSQSSLDELHCSGHRIATLHFWLLRPEGLDYAFGKVARQFSLKPGDRVWIFQAGWGGNLMAKLPQEQAGFRCVAPKTFGENITVLPLIVGPDLAPAPQTDCQN